MRVRVKIYRKSIIFKMNTYIYIYKYIICIFQKKDSVQIAKMFLSFFTRNSEIKNENLYHIFPIKKKKKSIQRANYYAIKMSNTFS